MRKRLRIISITVLVLIAVSCQVSVDPGGLLFKEPVWIFEIEGRPDENERGVFIQNTLDKGYITLSEITNQNGSLKRADGKDLLILKFDSDGATDSVFREVRFGGNGDETGVCIHQNSNGDGYLLAANTDSTGLSQISDYHGQTDALFVYLNNNGEIQWTYYYGGSGDDFVNGIRFSEDGERFYAFGKTNSKDNDFSSRDSDDFDGWTTEFDIGPGVPSVYDGGVYGERDRDDEVTQFIVEDDGVYFITGNSKQVDDQDIWLMKTDSLLATASWGNQFDTSGIETFSGIIRVGFHDYIMASEYNVNGNRDTLFRRFTTERLNSGTLNVKLDWHQRYDYAGRDERIFGFGGYKQPGFVFAGINVDPGKNNSLNVFYLLDVESGDMAEREIFEGDPGILYNDMSRKNSDNHYGIIGEKDADSVSERGSAERTYVNSSAIVGKL